MISGAECVKALWKVGFEVYRQRGSHIVLVRKSPPAQTTIPNHKELDRGTLRAIIRHTASPLMSSWHYFELTGGWISAVMDETTTVF